MPEESIDLKVLDLFDKSANIAASSNGVNPVWRRSSQELGVIPNSEPRLRNLDEIRPRRWCPPGHHSDRLQQARSASARPHSGSGARANTRAGCHFGHRHHACTCAGTRREEAVITLGWIRGSAVESQPLGGWLFSFLERAGNIGRVSRARATLLRVAI